jgi:hypothetical protein
LVGTLFALPLQWGAINLGVLEMYRAAPVISHPSLAEAAQR